MSGNRFLPRPKQKKYDVNNFSRSPKTAKQMERHLKGVANHRRIEILFLLAGEEGLNVEEISSRLHCNFKTISVHLNRLTQAGLIDKKYEGQSVRHRFTPYGRTFFAFLKTFQHS